MDPDVFSEKKEEANRPAKKQKGRSSALQHEGRWQVIDRAHKHDLRNIYEGGGRKERRREKKKKTIDDLNGFIRKQYCGEGEG